MRRAALAVLLIFFGAAAAPLDVDIPTRAASAAATCAKLQSLDTSFIASNRIHVIYGASLIGEPVSHGYGIVLAQLESLEKTGLLCPKCAMMHVVLTHSNTSSIIPDTNQASTANDIALTGDEAIKTIVEVVRRLSGNTATVRVERENLWEWPALSTLYSLAKQLSTGQVEIPGSAPLILYFHNKGCSHVLDTTGAALESTFAKTRLGSGWGRRTLYEMALFREVVSSWRYIVALFDSHGPAVQHAGLAPARGGFEWFNFFWSRPEYLARRSPPKHPRVGIDRHYYESWLGREIDRGATSSRIAGEGCDVALSLAGCSVGICGQAHWAEAALRKARKRLDAEYRAATGEEKRRVRCGR